jgi:hypothetical protein
MKRLNALVLIVAACLVGAALLIAQQSPRATRLPYEVVTLTPKETTPGKFAQVEARQIDQMSSDGWELIAATPWALMNEERTNAPTTPHPVVTQVYLAYVFRRGNLIR